MSKERCKEGEFTLRLHIRRLPEGGYLATAKNLPGLVAQGNTVEETVAIAQDVARKLVESYCEHQDRLPRALKRVPKDFEIDTAFAF